MMPLSGMAALFNLLLNATQAVAPGGRRVKARLSTKGPTVQSVAADFCNKIGPFRTSRYVRVMSGGPC